MSFLEPQVKNIVALQVYHTVPATERKLLASFHIVHAPLSLLNLAKENQLIVLIIFTCKAENAVSHVYQAVAIHSCRVK